jgi:hypothetical protein
MDPPSGFFNGAHPWVLVKIQIIFYEQQLVKIVKANLNMIGKK